MHYSLSHTMHIDVGAYMRNRQARARKHTRTRTARTRSLARLLDFLLACSRARSLSLTLTHFFSLSLFIFHVISLSPSPGARIGEARVVKRSELRGRSLLKHVRWPEFQREGLSEMFVCPDPAIGHLIQTLLIEALGVCVYGEGGGGG